MANRPGSERARGRFKAVHGPTLGHAIKHVLRLLKSPLWLKAMRADGSLLLQRKPGVAPPATDASLDVHVARLVRLALLGTAQLDSALGWGAIALRRGLPIAREEGRMSNWCSRAQNVRGQQTRDTWQAMLREVGGRQQQFSLFAVPPKLLPRRRVVAAGAVLEGN